MCVVNTKQMKGKFSLYLVKHHTLQAYGEPEIELHAFLTSTADGRELSASHPFWYHVRWKNLRFFFKRRLGGPHIGLGVLEKTEISWFRLKTNHNSSVVHAVPSSLRTSHREQLVAFWGHVKSLTDAEDDGGGRFNLSSCRRISPDFEIRQSATNAFR